MSSTTMVRNEQWLTNLPPNLLARVFRSLSMVVCSIAPGSQRSQPSVRQRARRRGRVRLRRPRCLLRRPLARDSITQAVRLSLQARRGPQRVGVHRLPHIPGRHRLRWRGRQAMPVASRGRKSRRSSGPRGIHICHESGRRGQGRDERVRRSAQGVGLQEEDKRRPDNLSEDVRRTLRPQPARAVHGFRVVWIPRCDGPP